MKAVRPVPIGVFVLVAYVIFCAILLLAIEAKAADPASEQRVLNDVWDDATDSLRTSPGIGAGATQNVQGTQAEGATSTANPVRVGG